jgi:hypothetical protein
MIDLLDEVVFGQSAVRLLLQQNRILEVVQQLHR